MKWNENGERERERERSMREEREIALCDFNCWTLRVKQKWKYKTAKDGARIKITRECCGNILTQQKKIKLHQQQNNDVNYNNIINTFIFKLSLCGFILSCKWSTMNIECITNASIRVRDSLTSAERVWQTLCTCIYVCLAIHSENCDRQAKNSLLI